jgi:outer membrane receptor for ferrienterochelin and colicins
MTSASARRWAGEVNLTARPHERHRLLVGGEYQYNSRQQQKNYDEDPFTLYLDDRRSSKRWAVYLQDEIRITDTLIANLGVRYERTYTSKKTINPRIALIYNPSGNTALKFLYGEAFRPANLYELYYQDNVSIKPNPAIEPERIRTYELVYEQRLSDAISMTAAGFYYKIKDLINQVIDPADELMVFVNHGEVKATGLELEVEGKWGNGLQGRISYAYTNARDGLTGGSPVNSPHHLATLNIIVPVVRDRVFLGAETQYTSSVKTLRGRKTDGFFLTNLTLFSKKLVKEMELSASVYNLFNKKYGYPGGPEHVMDTIPQDGRTCRVKLTYRF